MRAAILSATLFFASAQMALAQELTPEQTAAVDEVYKEAREVRRTAQSLFQVWWSGNANAIDDVALRMKCAGHAVAIVMVHFPDNVAALAEAKGKEKLVEVDIQSLRDSLSHSVWAATEGRPVSFTIQVAEMAQLAFENYRFGFSSGDPTNWFTAPSAYVSACRS